MHIKAVNDISLAVGMGFSHALDRGSQMILLRIIGQGRMGELLKADETTQEIDLYLRDVNFSEMSHKEVPNLKSETSKWLEAYCDGVNNYFEENGTPLEYKLVGYKYEPWIVGDCLMLVKVMAYFSLAQSQQDAEKLIITALRDGVDLNLMKDLFGNLDGLDTKTVELLKRVNIHQAFCPEEIKFNGVIPKVMASNNWVVAASRSESGNAISCNDPHLECNRLPSIWYEFVATVDDNYFMGVNMPGIPGTIMGRNKNVSYGFTYGFMDQVDYFIEEVKAGKYLYKGEWLELEVRKSKIKRKGKSDFNITFYETKHGVIENNSMLNSIKDGLYLCRALAFHNEGSATTLDALYDLHHIKTVKDMQSVSKNVTISCNWLAGDTEGNIGYQQSGSLPKRSHSGLYPVVGWDGLSDWDGLVAPDLLACDYNPENGVLATANNDMNQEGKPLSITMPMGDYREKRIYQLLSQKDKHSIASMQEMQKDLYSLQAQKFMAIIKESLPSNKAGNVLSNWNLCYDKNSQGAFLFEEFYRELLNEVFGKGKLGEEAWKFIDESTNIIVDFYHLFDRIFLDGDEASVTTWFLGSNRKETMKRVLTKVCESFESKSIKKWGDVRKFTMNNLFFDGKLPKFLGFDYGPFLLEGNRATIVQGALYEAHGRFTTFCPSWRYISDLGENKALTILAGGPSDRRFSKFYKTDVQDWLNFRYKTLEI